MTILQFFRVPLGKCPLPLLVALEKEHERGTVTFYVSPTSHWGGVINANGILRPSCPEYIRSEFYNWIMIQAERKRLGLPFLRSEEMVIRMRG